MHTVGPQHHRTHWPEGGEGRGGEGRDSVAVRVSVHVPSGPHIPRSSPLPPWTPTCLHMASSPPSPPLAPLALSLLNPASPPTCLHMASSTMASFTTSTLPAPSSSLRTWVWGGKGEGGRKEGSTPGSPGHGGTEGEGGRGGGAPVWRGVEEKGQQWREGVIRVHPARVWTTASLLCTAASPLAGWPGVAHTRPFLPPFLPRPSPPPTHLGQRGQQRAHKMHAGLERCDKGAERCHVIAEGTQWA